MYHDVVPQPVRVYHTSISALQRQKLQRHHKTVFEEASLIPQPDHPMPDIDNNDPIPAMHRNNILMNSPLTHLKCMCVLVNSVQLNELVRCCNQTGDEPELLLFVDDGFGGIKFIEGQVLYLLRWQDRCHQHVMTLCPSA